MIERKILRLSWEPRKSIQYVMNVMNADTSTSDFQTYSLNIVKYLWR